MSGLPDGPDNAPVVKVGLKRLNLDERVFSDDELRQCALVRALGDALMRELIAGGTGRRFPDSGRLFLEKDPGDSLFFILKGEARLWLNSGTDIVEVTIARKGEVLGEQEALGESRARALSAQALGDLEVIEFPSAAVAAMARRHPQFGAYLREVAEARKTASAEMTDFFNRW